MCEYKTLAYIHIWLYLKTVSGHIPSTSLVITYCSSWITSTRQSCQVNDMIMIPIRASVLTKSWHLWVYQDPSPTSLVHVTLKPPTSKWAITTISFAGHLICTVNFIYSNNIEGIKLKKIQRHWKKYIVNIHLLTI